VLEIPAGTPEGAKAHFGLRLRFETDPADVRRDQENDVRGFVLLDVRPRKGFEEGHIPGARSLPYADISPETVAGWNPDLLYVTYCWSTACNAGTKAGYLLADLGFRVKEMIGGMEAWRKEGYPVDTGSV
ncbi:MAG: rhodanese-like domain-containing protein, partial [Euryarchaeota archaeon]|nr:rhodanese-like domain-containing protein [Euryarchaeota archaeon]